MFRLKSIFKSLIWLVIPLVLALNFNQTSNWHYHVLDNGMVIEHSHPHKNSKTPGTPFQNHHHSDFEYQILAQLSVVFTLLAIFLILSFGIISANRFLKVFPIEFFRKEYWLANHPLRAPPLLALQA